MDIAFGIILAVAIMMWLATPDNSTIKRPWYKSNYDDTDDLANKKHSGMALWIDHGTGCHYLQASPFTPLVPRLDKDGKIVCEFQQKTNQQSEDE